MYPLFLLRLPVTGRGFIFSVALHQILCTVQCHCPALHISLWTGLAALLCRHVWSLASPQRLHGCPRARLAFPLPSTAAASGGVSSWPHDSLFSTGLPKRLLEYTLGHANLLRKPLPHKGPF